MKIVISFVLFISFFSANIFACQFKKGTYISISGPVTNLISELGLLSDPSLKAISTFNMIEDKKFKGDKIGGGILLSPKYFNRYKDPFIFFDDSREIRRSLKRMKRSKSFQVSTRGLDPFQAYNLSKNILMPHLDNCNSQIDEIEKKIKGVSLKLSGFKTIKYPILFYLGKLELGIKRPNLLMNKDGFVLSLLKDDKIRSYPSELKYLPWSEKIINSLRGTDRVIELGLVADGPRRNADFIKLTNNQFNVFSSTMLIPGISQIYFLGDLIQFLELISKDVK